MAENDVIGAAYYNMLSVHPLLKNNQFNPPARNLFRDNVLITDAVVQTANEIMGHQGSYGVSANSGAECIKVGGFRTSTTVSWGTFKDDISIFSDASAVPKDQVDLQGTQWLEEEEASKSNYFGQSIENHLMYGTNGPTPDTFAGTTPTALPQKYTGLAARFRVPDNADSTYDARNPDPTTAAQKGVYDAAGSGTDTTSIWFIRWGKRAVSLITPLNDPQYGYTVRDMGIQIEHEVNGTTHQPSKYREVYMKQWEWKHGLTIYPGENQNNTVARLRNIETALTFNNSGLKSKIYQIIREYFNSNTDGLFMYVPPRMMTIFDILFESKTNMQFTLENPYALSPKQWAGRIFIRQCRAISELETAVTAV